MNNYRLKLDRLAISLEDLATKGPLKPEELRGLQDIEEYVKNDDITTKDGLKKMPPQTGSRTIIDETHYRTGWLLEEPMTQKLLDYAKKLKELIHIGQVERKVTLNLAQMLELIEEVRGMIMITYPAYHGLGDWEPVRVILENGEEFDEKMNLTEDLEKEGA